MTSRWTYLLTLVLCGAHLAASRAAEQPLKIVTDNAEDLDLEESAPPTFQIKGPNYNAGVYKDGRMTITSASGIELLNDIQLSVENSRKMRDVRAKDGLVAVRRDHEIDAQSKVPGMNLQFFPTYIEITFVNVKHAKSLDAPPGAAVQGAFGADALSVRNLKNKKEDALPAKYMMSPFLFGIFGHFWPDIAVTYKDGT